MDDIAGFVDFAGFVDDFAGGCVGGFAATGFAGGCAVDLVVDLGRHLLLPKMSRSSMHMPSSDTAAIELPA